MTPLLRGALSAVAAAVLLTPIAPAPALAGAGLSQGAGFAEGAGAVTVTLRGTDPLRPVMVLTNAGSAACRVPVGPLGTIVLTGVDQGGTAVAPIGAEASLDMLEILTSQLRSLKPGESVEVPLRVLEWGPTGHAIQTVVWSPSAGAFASFYPVAAGQPLTLTGDYAAPLVTPDGGDPMCPPAAAAAAVGTITPSDTPGATKTTSWLVIGIAIAVVVAIVAVVVILLLLVRRNRRRNAQGGGGPPGDGSSPVASDGAASGTDPGQGPDSGPGTGSSAAAIVALVLVAGLLGAVSQAQPAAAKFNPSGGLSKAFNACLGIFKQPGFDPAGIIPTLEGSGVQVDIQPGTANQDDYGNGEYGISKTHMLITWNLDDYHQYYGTGGSADPCDSLYHELYHAYEHANGTYSYDQCVTNEDGATGLSKAEVRATRAQSKLRQKMGGPARSHYGNKKMPTGECLPPPDPGTCHDPERDKKIYKSAFLPGRAPRVRLPIAARDARTGRDGCGDSNGDPHLRTFDGLRYDFMAAGEFVLARDGDSYEIQVRQQPYPGSRTVAVNTAVAMKVGADRVEVRLTPGGTVTLLVNGTGAPLAKAKLPGGGAIEVTASRQVLVGWPDRSVATISPIGPWGLRVAPEPAEAHDGKLEGLLGDLNGDRANDLRIRGGNTITQPAAFEALYPGFADSWRIDAKSSLFTYEAGRGTSSYVDKSFPDRLDLAKLPNRAAAEAVCRRFGVSDPEVLAACIMDVALTGQPDFAAVAAEGQFFAAGSAFGGAEWTVRIKPGETATVEFDATAGQRVFIDAAGTLPDTCGILALRGPDGLLAGGCIINGKGYIDGTTLPVAGKHSIVVDPNGNDTGEVRLTLISIADQSGAISTGGAEVTARVDKPGVISRFTFTATAGEKVFVDIPSSSLPDQCGVLALRAPNSDVLAGGCVINGKGYIDGTTLPVSGTYTVVVDAQERYTGEAKLRLSSAIDQRSTISVNGAQVTATIGQAGAVSVLTFTGTAGQKVALDGTGSTLPDQCGVLHLRGPDNTLHASGCIIAGTASIQAFTLPTSGTYTITLDPGERATGTASLRLHT